ncbi:MAG TPA: RNB domain-containing ribonuclease, partial [Rhodocyclaceae bacterium]|nr:RNB domain-containing ribonuclease [Rhodocyclaceae bacterium]
FQRLMERYWCLRWLQQRSAEGVDATVRREQSVKLDHLPLVLRVPSLPADLMPGQRVRLAIESIDLLGPDLSCRFVETLADSDTIGAEDEEEQ